MQLTNVASSNIAAYAYDLAESRLYIRFHYFDRIYCFMGVPEIVWLAFQQAESKGQFFKDQIRNYFRYEQIEDAT